MRPLLEDSYVPCEREAIRWLVDRLGGNSWPQDLMEASPWMPFARGELCRALGDLDGARTWFKRAAASDPHSPLARAGLAMVEVSGGDRVAILQELASDAPQLVHPHLYLGLTLSGLGDRAAGIKELRRCAQLVPDDPRAWSRLATLLLAQGERGAAVEALEQWRRIQPHSSAAQRAAARGLFFAGRYLKAFRASFGVARRFGGWRNRAFPALLPLESMPPGRLRWFAATVGVFLLAGETWLSLRDGRFDLAPVVTLVSLGVWYSTVLLAQAQDRSHRRA